jgi:hypothetical protein
MQRKKLSPGGAGAWRTSSHSSGPAGTCVEVGQSARVLVRDTARRDSVTLAFPSRAWREFTASLQ